MRSNLAYMLLNEDLKAAQPGPRNYAHAWMRDGAVSTATYLRFGITDVPHDYLEWFTPLVREDGFVPFLVDGVTGKMLGCQRCGWKVAARWRLKTFRRGRGGFPTRSGGLAPGK